MTDGGLFLIAIIFVSKTSLCLGDDYYYAYGYNDLNEVDGFYDSYDNKYDEYGFRLFRFLWLLLVLVLLLVLFLNQYVYVSSPLITWKFF